MAARSDLAWEEVSGTVCAGSLRDEENPTVLLRHARLPALAALSFALKAYLKAPPTLVMGTSPSSLLTAVLIATHINKGRRGLGGVKCSDN